METKEIEISKDYYIFLMKDILERLKTITINEEKDNDLFSCVYIQNPYFRHGFEYIHLEKTDDKVVYYSEIKTYSNIFNDVDTTVLFFDKSDNVIGSFPPVDESTVKDLNNRIIENLLRDSLQSFTIINWKIEFELNKTDKNKVSVTLYKSDLFEIFGIDFSSANIFIHNSIAKEITSSGV